MPNIVGRPKKYRIVRQDPRISQFSPRGKPGRPDEVELSMDQFEAIRLADYMGLGQKEAAKSMRISQQTFSRVLKKARKSLANGLVNGAAIKIQGGSYIISSRENSPPDSLKKPPIP
ncbi:MAG: DUF134 domain-containing protein [Candidatus Omnitrophota bacterium]